MCVCAHSGLCNKPEESSQLCHKCGEQLPVGMRTGIYQTGQ